MAELALKNLQKTLVTWLQEEELRAKRALRVINQQRDQIRRLQRLANQNQSKPAPIFHEEMGRGELWMVKSLERLDLRSQEHSEEVKRIRQEIEETRAVLLRSKLRIEELERMVEGVDACHCAKDVHEMKELSREMSAWRWTIDEALGNMSPTGGVRDEEEEIRRDYLWKTALRFFTPQQVFFLLGGQIISDGWTGAK